MTKYDKSKEKKTSGYFPATGGDFLVLADPLDIAGISVKPTKFKVEKGEMIVTYNVNGTSNPKRILNSLEYRTRGLLDLLEKENNSLYLAGHKTPFSQNPISGSSGSGARIDKTSYDDATYVEEIRFRS